MDNPAQKVAELYYFELLPLHPQPQPLESLTSYLSRLAISNGFISFAALSELVFPARHQASLYHFKDCPPLSLGKLPLITSHPATILLPTTFYHLARKFGRSVATAQVTHFLDGSLAQHLRFCPRCLQDYNCYFLTWRFKALRGCAEHGCHLLEQCGQCGQEIPLLTNPLSIGVCPGCKKALKSVVSPALSKRRREASLRQQRDLAYLLTPEPMEADEVAPQVVKQLGRDLRQRRLSRSQSIREVAKALKLPSAQIVFIEQGRLKQGTASFRAYQIYANYFDLTLFDLFAMVRAELV